MAPESAHFPECQVCGHSDHVFRHHLGDVKVPEFVHTAVGRLRQLERESSDIEVLVDEISGLAGSEEGGNKAWALWLLTLLRELEDASDAPDVAAEIENLLLGGY